MRRRRVKNGWFFRRKRPRPASYARYYSAPTPRKKSEGIVRQFRHLSSETKKTLMSILLLALGVFMFLSLFRLAGSAGVFLNYYFAQAFGFGRWYAPAIFILTAFFFMIPTKRKISGVLIFGALLLILSFNGFLHMMLYHETLFSAAQEGRGGGYIGLILSYPLNQTTGFVAGSFILLGLFFVSFILFFNTSFQSIFQKGGNFLRIFKIFGSKKSAHESREAQESAHNEVEVEFSSKTIPVDEEETEENKNEENKEAQDEKAGERHAQKHFPKIDIPVDLLDSSNHKPRGGDIEANQEIIQKTLANFSIPVEMGEVNVGPTVTQYAIKPAEGIKLSKIVSLNDNLALALAAHPIRIEAPIPGKSLVGIEVPNKISALVTLRSLIESNEFRSRKTNLSVAIGKDVKGTPWFGNLGKMPHLLIAGSTGSGKSVCINSVIVSLLFQNGPSDLKFILVDPKRVELPVYNGIPHLAIPVITDVKKTVNALRWTILEMEKRFDKLAEFHKRDIESYNREMEEKMSYIVFIIDELADLMAAAGPEIEGLIIRLAQMSRAVGIHLILATQRPSVDVITGLIKANITARIAFSVASAVDSRTILDMSGAEKLLGRGDMLYVTAELSKPKRLQGAFASEEEIKRVIEYLKNQAGPEYIEEIVEKTVEVPGINFETAGVEGGDSLLPEAKKVIIQAGKASSSLLQRRLKIGYARAARILDLLEEQGVVGPGDGAKAREILVRHSEDIEGVSEDIDENEE